MGAHDNTEEAMEAKAQRLAIARGINERATARFQALERGEKPPEEPVVPAGYWEERGVSNVAP